MTLKDNYSFITERIAKRVKKEFKQNKINGKINNRADALKVKEEDGTTIEASVTDQRILSMVMNNKMSSKKNPYLLTANVQYEILKSKNFKFKNAYELIWGTSEEINQYFLELYKDCWKCLEESKGRNEISKVLAAYLPYIQKYSELKNYKDTERDRMTETIDFNSTDYKEELEKEEKALNQKVEKKYESIKEKAIKYLWTIEQSNFIEQHKIFFEKPENSTTLKLNKKLDTFYTKYFDAVSTDLKLDGKFNSVLLNQRKHYKMMKEEKLNNLENELKLIIPQDLEIYFHGLAYSAPEIMADPSLAGETKIPKLNEPHDNNRYLKIKKKVKIVEKKYQKPIKLLNDSINGLDDYLSKLENIQSKDIFI